MSPSIFDRRSRLKISKDIEDLIYMIHQLDQIDTIEHSIQQQQNIHYFQVHIEHLPRWTMFWAIKQISINLKGFKSTKHVL